MSKPEPDPHVGSEAANLELALEWIAKVVTGYLAVRFGQADSFRPPPLEFCSEDSPLEMFIKSQDPTMEEFAVVMMALAPHLRPGFFNQILAQFFPEGGELHEFGGVSGADHRAILPTGETAQFVLAGRDVHRRIEVQRLFCREHWFAAKKVLWLDSVRSGAPAMSGRLCIDPELVEWVTLGTVTSSPGRGS